MVILAEIHEQLFQVDLRSPADQAKSWIGDRWVDDTLTNQDVLYSQDCRLHGRVFAESWTEAVTDIRPLPLYR